MTTDEAYYWVWTQRPLQLSYFDHPPFVAWLMTLGNLFQGIGNAVRWPGVILGHCTLLIFALLLKNFFAIPEEKISRWFWLALFSPLIGFGSLILTPDLPLVFFWVLSLYCFLQLLNKPSAMNYAFLGVALGLGFCAKYHIVLFVFSALAYLGFEKKWKKIVIRYVPFTLISGLIFSLPVIIWNMQNDFASFHFQMNRGFKGESFNLSLTGDYVLGQIVLLFPILIWLAWKTKPQDLLKSFVYFTWLPIIFFFFTSFRGQVEANWTIMAFPTFLALAVLGANSLKPLAVTMAFWISIFTVIFSQLLFPWMPSAPEKLSEYSQFLPILHIKERYQPLYASTYQMASALWYETKEPFFKLNKMSRWDLFDTFPESIPSEYPIFVVKRSFADLPEWTQTGFSVTEMEKIENDFVVMKVEKL